jgi:hypothetical protein
LIFSTHWIDTEPVRKGRFFYWRKQYMSVEPKCVQVDSSNDDLSRLQKELKAQRRIARGMQSLPGQSLPGQSVRRKLNPLAKRSNYHPSPSLTVSKKSSPSSKRPSPQNNTGTTSGSSFNSADLDLMKEFAQMGDQPGLFRRTTRGPRRHHERVERSEHNATRIL